ncbi:transporter [Vibrio sp. 10N.286.49.C2]|uniref:ComEA family DNA-binding protein n=1 Tax=unclassified Vibrio TaxID=2614977 RepID=UPI000C862E86|nr:MULTISPECIES: helix-hairpin-helix domain-containing protein [unclassified Vibrio]PMH33078.1 transporter [Vibrio sp. 10N.286.49.C2]PMH48975.1 transporter [Vibrio sp. 10N.286.49.B1]PMH78598.1 transporter [Vibrio sp. 10N.286.48.B7]
MKVLLSAWLVVLFTLSPLSTSFAANADKLEGIDITVNVNQADPDEIAALLSGIGIEKAKSIVEYRDKHGEFKTIDDLTHVKGVGPATVEKNRSRILL